MSKEGYAALAEVMIAFLDGCGGMETANLKMMMMLSQSFYHSGPAKRMSVVKSAGEGYSGAIEMEPQGGDRSKRVFLKEAIMEHSTWSDPSFWDSALLQCVSEALSHSNVLPSLLAAVNVEGRMSPANGAARGAKGASVGSWHDLPDSSRLSAAQQVHDVVLAQLAALSHSMMEFGESERVEKRKASKSIAVVSNAVYITSLGTTHFACCRVRRREDRGIPQEDGREISGWKRGSGGNASPRRRERSLGVFFIQNLVTPIPM